MLVKYFFANKILCLQSDSNTEPFKSDCGKVVIYINSTTLWHRLFSLLGYIFYRSTVNSEGSNILYVYYSSTLTLTFIKSVGYSLQCLT
jgi:hypothetical protein